MKHANAPMLLLLSVASTVSRAQVVKDLSLKTTTMREGSFVTASCSSNGCEVTVPLVQPVPAVCPVAAGETKCDLVKAKAAHPARALSKGHGSGSVTKY